MRNIVVAIVLGGSVAVNATAAEIKVLSAGAVEPGLHAFVSAGVE